MVRYSSIIFTVFLFLLSCNGSQSGDTSVPGPELGGDFSLDDIVQLFDKQEVYISMRDGTRLFTSVYTPKDTSDSYPILIHRTPYNIEPDKDSYNDRLLKYEHLIKEGYIFVFQDVRGKYMSEGDYVNVRPYIPNKEGDETDENSDTYDTIEWLINNIDNHNGNVGVYGISYPGFYSTISIPEAHPALKAVSPQAPVTNWFIGDDFHHHGAFFLMDAFSFFVERGFGWPRPEPTREKPEGLDIGNPDNYDFYLELGPVKNVEEKYTGDSILFWSKVMDHPDYDDFWQLQDPRPHLTDVKPAVLVVGGWFDAEDLFGPLSVYEAIEEQNPLNQNRLVMGPWSHGQWSGNSATHLGNIHWGSNTADYYKEIESNFFNYYLKDKGNMDLPEASIFITGANEWRDFENWPPDNVEEANLFLQENGGLSFSRPAEDLSFDEYVSDPGNPVPYTEDIHFKRTIEYLTDDQRFAARRPDVMNYTTDILTEDITITGPLQVDFYVTTTGTDADYIIKLIDEYPENAKSNDGKSSKVPMGGYQMLVRGEVLRGRYRNSYENPEPLVPGEITRISYEIPDLAHTFRKGHRIMIQVQNSWFPLVDRNPQKFVNIYECDEEDFTKATHQIYHDAQRPSHVKALILKE